MQRLWLKQSFSRGQEPHYFAMCLSHHSEECHTESLGTGFFREIEQTSQAIKDGERKKKSLNINRSHWVLLTNTFGKQMQV